MATNNRKNILILSLTLAVVMLGFGMVMPIFPFYIESMGASGSELGLLVAISPLMQLIMAPIWGSVSDRHGRKPVLVVGLLGYGISMLLFGLATELWMLFVARGVGAILSAATMPTTMAYISDSTSEKERGGGIGMLGAATGLGVVLGPALGGWLGADSLSTPFFITAGVCLLTLLLVVLFLPESLPAAERQTAAIRIRPVAQLRELWRALSGPLGVLLLMAFLVSFGLTCFQAIFGLYALEKFGYGTRRGRLDPHRRWGRVCCHPGDLDRAADQALGRGDGYQGHAVGQRGQLWTAADGEHPAGDPADHGAFHPAQRPAASSRDLVDLKAGGHAAGRCHGAQ